MKDNPMIVTLVGLGGTGSHILKQVVGLPVLIRIIDRDIVEKSNLRRQIIYSRKDIGLPKAECAKLNIGSSNIVCALTEDLDGSNADFLLKGSTIVIECTDNISTRLLINDYCRKNNIPWVSTAAIGDVGQILQIPATAKKRPSNSSGYDSPCYQCIFGEKYGDSCNHADVELKVLEKLATVVKSTVEDFIFLGKISSKLCRLSSSGPENYLNVKADGDCHACRGDYQYLDGKKSRLAKALCGNDRFMIDLKRTLDLSQVASKVHGTKKVSKYALIMPDITLLSSGKAIIKAGSLKDAKKKFDKEIGI